MTIIMLLRTVILYYIVFGFDPYIMITSVRDRGKLVYRCLLLMYQNILQYFRMIINLYGVQKKDLSMLRLEYIPIRDVLPPIEL